MSSQGGVLVIDDEPATGWTLQRLLAGWRCVSLPADGASLLPPPADGAAPDIELVFASLLDPEARTARLVRDLRERAPGVPVLLVGSDARGSAAAVRVGAFDYLRKPLEPDAVLLAVQRALDWRRLEMANGHLEHTLSLLRRRLREAEDHAGSAVPCRELRCAVRERLSLRELEDRYVDSVLGLTGGNKVRAAEILGIDRRTLYRRERRRGDGDR